MLSALLVESYNRKFYLITWARCICTCLFLFAEQMSPVMHKKWKLYWDVSFKWYLFPLTCKYVTHAEWEWSFPRFSKCSNGRSWMQQGFNTKHTVSECKNTIHHINTLCRHIQSAQVFCCGFPPGWWVGVFLEVNLEVLPKVNGIINNLCAAGWKTCSGVYRWRKCNITQQPLVRLTGS